MKFLFKMNINDLRHYKNFVFEQKENSSWSCFVGKPLSTIQAVQWSSYSVNASAGFRVHLRCFKITQYIHLKTIAQKLSENAKIYSNGYFSCFHFVPTGAINGIIIQFTVTHLVTSRRGGMREIRKRQIKFFEAKKCSLSCETYFKKCRER